MSVTHLHGDCRDVLTTLPDKSVQCCVTSPPYWGLRDYGTAKWEGGDAACDHEPDEEWVRVRFLQSVGITGGISNQRNAARVHWLAQTPGRCPRCNAAKIDSQLGLEKTPDEYVAKMVAVFREVKRVLRDDGTLWLNLGDSFASGAGGRGDAGRNFHEPGTGGAASYKHDGKRIRREPPTGLKPKDLVGIPWRVAFALQADGWYLRSDIIWHKPNPMPESVTDRPTKAHEYLFLLTKSASYFYDADAVAEEATNREPGNVTHKGAAAYANGDKHHRTKVGLVTIGARATRNRRSVWTVASRPYKGAHFATFPPKLIEPCILAGSRVGDTVLDPFGGSGTTAAVAEQHGRDAILIELNESYIDLQRERMAKVQPALGVA